ncbi:MAG TPA: enoyl-CoA hydratase-related protein [Acidimicrobiales bacterium]|jgi:enoyl-CoA hydratase/carnithine racemase|nr:enoyl-CoA hydratase-related protein [Acidimicrobiales bacterium]
MPELVHREDRAGSAVLTLDSPANRNALSRQLVDELNRHLADAADDSGVRAVALTATGRTFCAGADLTDPPLQSGRGSFPDVLQRLWDYPKPVVAAVNGHVRAGGLGLVAAADVAIAVTAATFAFTEVRLGLSPAVISVLCLRRMTPVSSARYLLTGEQFDSDEAVRAGLISQVVDDGDLGIETDRILDAFAACEPEALQVTRQLMHAVAEMDVDAGIAHAQGISQKMFATAAAAEGIAAFKEKRAPYWAVRNPPPG